MMNVLFVAHADAGQEARLQAALDLVRTIGGHLICVEATVTPFVDAGLIEMGGYAVLAGEERSRQDENRAAITARLETEDVAWSWSDAVGDLGVAIERAARMADVVVLNTALDDPLGQEFGRIIGALLVDLDRTVLAVPPSISRVDYHGHAVVAWIGSSACEAALRVAVPLLARAERVTLLELDGERSAVKSDAAAMYLSRHGVRSTIVPQTAGGRPIGEALIAETLKLGPDYLVMGGYGHSRLREALFGGATATFLKQGPVPVLLVHG
ncbi:universal stress protein [Sphingomonas sp. SFZ2018-12]|nr:universal stress protein [Sphingomonas sp. SFZ2018-12]